MVYAWHIETYAKEKPATVQYISDTMILVEGKLGILTTKVGLLMNEAAGPLKEFR